MSALLQLMGIGSGVSWIVYAVVFGLGVAAGAGPSIWIEEERISGYERETAAADKAADLASQDATRWHAASDVRDGAIGILNGKLAEQSAAAEKARFARSQADQAQAKAEAETRDARAAFDARLTEIEAEAKAHPEQVVPLGPIVKQRAPHLFDKDTPPGV